MSTRSRRDDKNTKSRLKKYDESSESSEDKSSIVSKNTTNGSQTNNNNNNNKPDANLVANLESITGILDYYKL
jgi:hypothetical protein